MTADRLAEIRDRLTAATDTTLTPAEARALLAAYDALAAERDAAVEAYDLAGTALGTVSLDAVSLVMSRGERLAEGIRTVVEARDRLTAREAEVERLYVAEQASHRATAGRVEEMTRALANERTAKEHAERALLSESIHLGGKVEAAESRAEALAGALGRYGRHDPACTFDAFDDEPTCKCGLSALLAPPADAAGPAEGGR